MSRLDQAVEDYLTMRRACGFKLARHGRLLPRFAAFLDEQGATSITNELSLRWAKHPESADPSVWVQRLTAVRGFARYMSAVDPKTEVPARDLLVSPGRRNRRAEPYLYSPSDVTALMEAARELPPLRAATYETVVGLLVVTGIRVGELIRLDRDDVDFANHLLVIRDSKLGKSREVPLHETTLGALAAYLARRDELFPGPTAPSLFISTTGTRLIYQCVRTVFAELVRRAGLKPRSERCRPRIHDARHSFAVTTLIEWYRTGADVAALLPQLSTMLGHVNPASTYWYLEAVPELLELAAGRAQTGAARRS
jgi:integrase/recombinase XerD